MKRFDMIFKQMSILLIFFNGICLLCADEVKSFATEEEQQKYIAELIQKLPKPEKLMSIEDARKKLRTKEEVTAFAEAWGRRGRFIIAGKVTDEKGNLLNDVNLKIVKSMSGFWKSKDEGQEVVVNGYFTIFVSECDSLHLSVFKKDYVIKKQSSMFSYLNYNTDYKNNKTPDISFNEDILIAREQTIELIKCGDFLSLQKMDCRLPFDSDIQKNQIFLLKSWKISLETNQIKEPYLRIRYKRGKAGEILMKNIKSIYGNYQVPKEVFFELVSKKEEDGFNFNIKDELQYEAPKDGYNTKLIPLEISDRVIKHYSFYYTVDEKYGKGSISFSPMQSSHLKLFQNNENAADKKRNLWTE